MRRVVAMNERDRELAAYLALARYLSTEQIGALVFPGTSENRLRRRLRDLAADAEGGTALEGRASNGRATLKPLMSRRLDGTPLNAWALTERGYALANQRLGSAIDAPLKDVGADFLEHSLVLNQLFVDLLRSGPVRPRHDPRAHAAYGFYFDNLRQFTWSSAELSRLPWQSFSSDHVRENRLIEADAIISIPSAKRRLFVENEMGTHPIESSNPARRGATLAKVENYERYFNSLADPTERRTFYGTAFPDGFAPGLLILVRSMARRDHVLKAIADARQKRPDWRISVSCLVLEEAVPSVGKLIYGAGFRPEGAAASSDGKAARESCPRPESALSALNDGDVSTIRAFFNEAVSSLKAARAQIKEHRAGGKVTFALPEYPSSAQDVLALIKRIENR
jgi:hypothetical protein